MPITAPTPLVKVLPQFMISAAVDYKTLAADYQSITDPALKSAYKAVLDKKIADLHAMLATYTSAAAEAIAEMAVA